MMKKTKIQKMMLLFATVLFISASGYSQLFKPVVTDIGDPVRNNKFVLVIKASENRNLPERAVMSDWTPSEEPFDPDKLNEYPKWSFQNFYVYQNDGTKVRHIIVKNETTGMYFSYPSGPKMRAKKEFDAYFARDDQNKYKKSLKEQYEFLFIPQVMENYIRLGIPNDEGKNLAVTPGAWQHIRQFRLVLVK
jgi:hypothetical protein